jgi:hypothetical protein
MLGSICGVAFIAVFVVSSAVAFTTRALTGRFGSDGTMASEFATPWSIGTDSSSGDIYVASLGGTIEKFNAAHEPEPFTGTGPQVVGGELTGFGVSITSQIAVDSATHDFYVASGGSAVSAYQADGEPADFSAGPGAGTNEIAGSELCGVAVDSNGNIYLSEFSSGVRIFEPSGELLATIPSSGTCNLAVDSHGNVYLDQPGGQLERLEPSAFPITSATVYSGPITVDSNPSNAVIVDPSDDHVDVDEGSQVAEYDQAGDRLGAFGADGSEALVGSTGLAIDAAGQVYAVNDEGSLKQVDIFGPPVLLPPSIDAASVANLTSSSAELTAQINPGGLNASYHFEYGTSTDYGTSVPVADQGIGNGFGDVAVVGLIGGLSPNVTYHWRIVATGQGGVRTGSDHTFIDNTQGEGLPNGRAYEMVTPPQKNGALIGSVLLGLRTDISEDGSRVIASSIQCFANAESCTGSRQHEGEQFLFTRSANGWTTTALAPPATRFEANSSWLDSADTGMELFSMPTPPSLEDDFYVREPGGSFVDIGAATPPASGPQGEPWGARAMKATSDFSRVIFQENGLWPFAEEANGLLPYELSDADGGVPELVGVSGTAGSTSLISKCNTALGSAPNTVSPGALSANGEIVYFTAYACPSGTGLNTGVEVPANMLYARIGEARTVKISERSATDCVTVACHNSPPRNAIFVGASSDGSKAFFISDQQLTDSASSEGNLYEYDLDKPAGESLIDVSAGDSSGEGPRVQGVMAVSSDGSHIYFVAKGVLAVAANGRRETAQSGSNNLYVFERDASHPDGQTRFIASLPESEAEEQWLSGNQSPGQANVTPDGRFFVFESGGQLTADDTRTDDAKQIFRYDAQAGELVRVSVGERGFDDDGNAGAGNAKIVPGREGANHAGAARSDPTMSNDGRYIFFEDPQALTSHALNDVQIGTLNGEAVYAENVYEWDEGQISLISDGKDTKELANESAVRLIGSDATGANVFFRTADALLSQDTDTQMDYYDARICTAAEPCVVSRVSSSPPCLGEACRGTPESMPLEPTGGSATLNSLVSLPHVEKALKKAHKKQKKKRKCPKGKRRLRGKCVKVKDVNVRSGGRGK